MVCLSCKSNEGIKRISPGVQIFESEYWLVEHAYPCSLEGWLVIVLKRHCEEFHNLSREEFLELSHVQLAVIKAIHQYFHSEKEYIFCFAEAEGFKHIHFHVVPKTKDFDTQYQGAKVFHYLKTPKEKCVSQPRIKEICKELKAIMEKR
ncbi:MAG: HIT domain-containing protein [Bacteroidia bacterium]|nr:HIT domain-containing protein [Bacteroidia bacterium]